MTNNKLTDGRSRLREAAKNYQTALAWYQSNIDSPAALQAWDTATAEFMSAIGNRETDIIADLLNEIDALTKHAEILVAGIDSPVAYLYRQSDEMKNIFGTGESWEINDRFFESDLPVVEIPESDDCEFMPLYAAPQPLTDAERAELQERRKAAAEPVAYRKFVKDDCNSLLDGYEYFDSQGKSGSREPLYAAPQPAPAMPEEAYSDDCPDLYPNQPEAWAAGWNACRAATLQSFGNTEQLNQAPVKQPASKCPKCGDRGTYYDSQMRGNVFCDHVLKLVSPPYKLPPNSFTDADLAMMAHGDNPQANAYRELLAFRRNSPVTPDGSTCKYCGGTGYFRWQQSENMCPCPCKGCTELVAPQLGGKDD